MSENNTEEFRIDLFEMFNLPTDFVFDNQLFPEKSLPFDQFLALEHRELNKLIDKLTIEETNDTTRRKRDKKTLKKFVLSLELIILNLLRVHIARHLVNSNSITLGLPLAAKDYSVSNRYSQEGISYRTFKDAYDFLARSHYIEVVHQGYFDKTRNYGEITKVGPTKKTEEIFREIFPNNIAFFTRHENEETIVLRSAKIDGGENIEYKDTKFTNCSRNNLHLINSAFESRWFDLDLDDIQFSALHEKMTAANDKDAYKPFIIDYSRRTMRRIFNNGTFTQGGRFYGGWWQRIPSEYRKHITIDGKRTVEVDFSNMQPALLYAKESLPLMEDAYTIEPLGKEKRNLVKIAFLRLLNGDENLTGRAPKDYNEDEHGISWDNLIECIKREHQAISKYFSSGIGVSLMFEEAQIAERIMLHFINKGYSCLPVHDSFIVHHALKDELEEVMKAEYRKQVGIDIAVDAEVQNNDYMPPIIPFNFDNGFAKFDSEADKRLHEWFSYKSKYLSINS